MKIVAQLKQPIAKEMELFEEKFSASMRSHVALLVISIRKIVPVLMLEVLRCGLDTNPNIKGVIFDLD
ncbi:MAG: hypothetical protein ACPF95_01690, partial [Flavobacteriaceae bacterium]